jgi:hypothetical protein
MIVFAYDTNIRLAVIHPVAHKQKETTQFNEPKFCMSEPCPVTTHHMASHTVMYKIITHVLL